MTDIEYLFDSYEFIHDDLKFILKSSIRMKILISLKDGPRLIREIREEHNLSFANISNNMKLLLEKQMVNKVNDYYHISQLGEYKLNQVLHFMESMQVTKNFEELWNNHDINGLPDDLICEMGILNDSIMIRSDNKDVFRPYTEFYKIMSNAKRIRGISPFFNPADYDLFNSIAKNNVKIDLITTDEVLEQIVKMTKLNNLLTEINIFIKNNLTFWRYDGDITIGFTVTDQCISLGLLNDNGSYDQNRDLINGSDEAIDWGERLFDYYLSKSEKVSAIKLAGYFISRK
jgi:predicted transcriptional regulator